MNKDFSQKKLLSFDTEKQIRVLFELASHIEDNQLEVSSIQFLKLTRYHDDLKLSESEFIQKLSKEFYKVKQLDYQFQIYLMNLERLLGQSKKEYAFLIRTKDTENTPKTFPIVCVLDSVRSAHNIGSMFRNAECFGVDKVYLCGLSPDSKHPQVIKTAMGTTELTSSEYIKDAKVCVQKLKDDGYKIIAVETAHNATILEKFEPGSEKLALLFGHEQFGLSLELLEMSDHIIKIDLSGRKNSLNVSISQAIVLNHLTGQLA